MSSVIVKETGKTGSILAAGTHDVIEMMMTESGRTVVRMSPLLWLYYMDWIKTLRKRM